MAATDDSPGAVQGVLNASPPVVLFFTDNGAGLGHLTRLLAVAKRADGRFQPVFLTLSLGYPLLRRAGIPSEYFPSYSKLGLSKSEWADLLTARLAEMITQVKARVVVVDHVSPTNSFEVLRRSIPGVEFIWSRRGLWREGANLHTLRLGEGFDLVVEPGDLAAPIDHGATATHRRGVRHIEPILLVEPNEALPRREARQALGLPLGGRSVLLQLGDSSPEDVRSHLSHVRDSIRSVLGDEDVHFFAPMHPLHGDEVGPVTDVVIKPVYPIARYLNAFDAAVSNAGYNSFHEIVASGLPALFVSRPSNIDDQERRGRFAALCGRAQWCRSLYDGEFEPALRRLLRPREGDIAAALTPILGPMSGAAQFADLIADRLARAPGASVTSSDEMITALDEAAAERRRLRRADSAVGGRRNTVLVVALSHDATDVRRLTSEVSRLRRERLRFDPVLVVRSDAAGDLSREGYVFETVMTEEEWSRLRPDGYGEFMARRIEGLVARYDPRSIVTAEPGTEIAPIIRRDLGPGRPPGTGQGATTG